MQLSLDRFRRDSGKRTAIIGVMRGKYLAICSLVAAAGVHASVLTVTNVNDSGPGSLRQAITDANVDPAQDTIAFNIPGTGVHVIEIAGTMPPLNYPVVIDGYTQPGSRANTLAVGDNALIRIHLHGTGVYHDGYVYNTATTVFDVRGGNTNIRGLAITGVDQAIALGFQHGGNVIQGNFLGVDPSGTAAGQTNNAGIRVETPDTTIGGTAPADRNVISGNGDAIYGTNLSGTIAGNYIGTDATGMAAVPNGNAIYFAQGGTPSAHFTIGGTAPGAGNVISGNGLGIYLGASGIFGGGHGGYVTSADYVTIAGNWIGTAADRRTPLGNRLSGIYFMFGSNNTIGGLDSAAGNTIAFNGGGGVKIANGAGNRVLTNAIYHNSGLGIALLNGGRSNDPQDADAGANHLQNYPVLTDSHIANGVATSNGTLNSTPDSKFTLQFFADSRNLAQPGQTYLGSTNVTTDATGNAPFSVQFPISDGNVFINATATSATGDTSQFYHDPPRLVNISTRLRVESGDNALIGGFIIAGEQAQIVLRGLGPSLNVAGALQDPIIHLFDGSGTLLGISDNWRNDSSPSDLGVLTPTNDAESALIRYLPPGAYTVTLSGSDGGTGVGLVEAYLTYGDYGELANISTRGLVGTGDNVIVAGLIATDSTGPAQYLIRGLGPSLANAGVTNALIDPTLTLYDSDGDLVATNDDWKTGDRTSIEQTGLAPQNDAESVILTYLQVGAYTAIVRGKGDATGLASVELYNLH